MATPPSFDAFVDGSLVEVFFAGEVITKTFPKATNQTVSLTGGSGTGDADAVSLRLDAWRMNASVFGPPEWP